MKEKVTLLTKKQLKNLEVLKKYGICTESTDFCMTQSGTSCCMYWTKTPRSDSTSRVFYVDGSSGYVHHYDAYYTRAVRPVIPLSEIYKSKQNINSKIINGIEEIEYGEYPQNIVDENTENLLEQLYGNKKLAKTNKMYTSMRNKIIKEYEEYKYQGNKYVKVNDQWFKVEPIKWLVDEKKGIAISKLGLTGMPFSYYDGKIKYKKSAIKEFLEKYFIKEIIPSKVIYKHIDIEKEKILKKIEKKNYKTDLCILNFNDFFHKGFYLVDNFDYDKRIDGLFFVDIYNNPEEKVGVCEIHPILPMLKLFKNREEFNNIPLDEIREIEYGEYPQSAVDDKLNKRLDRLCRFCILNKTSKTYNILKPDGEIVEYTEYEYKGNKYVRVDGNWFKVEPIKWIVDYKTDMVISKNSITYMNFSGDSYKQNKEIEAIMDDIISDKDIVITKVESERVFKQKEYLNEKLEKSKEIRKKAVEKEVKAKIEAKRLKEETIRSQQEIKYIEDGLVKGFEDLTKKYDRLLELDSSKEIKYPHICIEKDILCSYDIKDKCYKIKDKFVPYLSYIQFPYDMDNVDIRGLDLSDKKIISIDNVYNKNLEGCNLNRNKYILSEVGDFDGYNLKDASVYSDTILFLRGAYINKNTIKSINKKYIIEAIEGAIIDKDSIEFLNNHREEYGINQSIKVKVRDKDKIEDVLLFPEFSEEDALMKYRYNEMIKEFDEKGFSLNDLKNMVNIIEERNKENNVKYKCK